MLAGIVNELSFEQPLKQDSFNSVILQGLVKIIFVKSEQFLKHDKPRLVIVEGIIISFNCEQSSKNELSIETTPSGINTLVTEENNVI
jgi:cAMP phosphodiesterase